MFTKTQVVREIAEEKLVVSVDKKQTVFSAKQSGEYKRIRRQNT